MAVVSTTAGLLGQQYCTTASWQGCCVPDAAMLNTCTGGRAADAIDSPSFRRKQLILLLAALQIVSCELNEALRVDQPVPDILSQFNLQC